MGRSSGQPGTSAAGRQFEVLLERSGVAFERHKNLREAWSVDHQHAADASEHRISTHLQLRTAATEHTA